MNSQEMLKSLTPLVPRITKSTSVALIRARFENDGDLLTRFEIAKDMANLWDGERDGLREAVKVITPAAYKASSGGTIVLSRTVSAEVMYPNAEGKNQLESCLQTSIPQLVGVPAGEGMIAFLFPEGSTEDFLDTILSHLQKGKEHALEFLDNAYIGSGKIVDNDSLYSKKGSEKSTITVIP